MYYVLGDVISCTDAFKNLGFYIDKDLKFEQQINETCKTCYFYLYLIGKKKNLLSYSVLKSVIEAFLLSRLNFCCTLYYDLPQYLINRLQKVQNAAARLIVNKRKSDHISSTLIDLKWLDISNFILFRNLCIVYKCFCEVMPLYLTHDLRMQSNDQHNLRSNHSTLLQIE